MRPVHAFARELLGKVCKANVSANRPGGHIYSGTGFDGESNSQEKLVFFLVWRRSIGVRGFWKGRREKEAGEPRLVGSYNVTFRGFFELAAANVLRIIIMFLLLSLLLFYRMALIQCWCLAGTCIIAYQWYCTCQTTGGKGVECENARIKNKD